MIGLSFCIVIALGGNGCKSSCHMFEFRVRFGKQSFEIEGMELSNGVSEVFGGYARLLADNQVISVFVNNLISQSS